MGATLETFDRRPDFFACHRVQPLHRLILAEADGRVVGVMAGVLQAPLIQGEARRLVYIQRARVDPDHQGKKVAWNLANDLFRWSHERGAEGPYYLILPGNERSISFGGRAGRRWPVEVRLVAYDVSAVGAETSQGLEACDLDEVVELVNKTHAGEDFFESLTPKSLQERLGRDPQYGIANLKCVREGGRVVAAAGFWDKGATTEAIHRDATSGKEERSRGVNVTDWGWTPGHEEAFAAVLRSLAAQARALGRDTLTVCEPSPGRLPDIGLPSRTTEVSLFTPSFDPPPADAIKGLCVDLLTV
jgi:GNAT superfamily N-acetyltransferase